jgi:hypothetical protein
VRSVSGGALPLFGTLSLSDCSDLLTGYSRL